MPASHYENAVAEFHEAFGASRNVTEPTKDLLILRRRLIDEESLEVYDALNAYIMALGVGVSSEALAEFKAALAKELADLLYVVFGTTDALDIPIQVVYNRVHKSNMSKLGEDGKPVRREDGKVLKSNLYQPPDIISLFTENKA